LVLRFNDAITQGHEEDVGSRPPTIRLINGQLPLRWGKKRRQYVESLLLPSANQTSTSPDAALIFWHHCCCGLVKLKDCLELDPESGMVRKVYREEDSSPDGFKTYFETIEQYRGRAIYLANHEYVHQLSTFLGDAYGRPFVADRPPSSGFIGQTLLI
jgi:hypothetical protein